MSLKLAAQHLASKGRGPDTTLVHMAPQEVAGLQALARAHGGTLTTNPDTGLPEAGFLRAILPMVAGAALTATGVGAPMAALMVGGGTGLATGSLRKGLMAGLGAYGGAGLMGSVMGSGANALGQAAATAPTPALPDASVMGYDVAAFPAPAAPAAMTAAPGAVPIDLALPQGTPLAPMAPAGLTPQGIEAYVARPPLPADATVMGYDTGAFQPAASAATPATTTATTTATPAADTYRNQMDIASDRAAAVREAGKFNQFKAGLGAVVDKPELLFNKGNIKYAAAAAAPLMFQEPEKRAEYQGGGSNPYQYEYDPGRQAYTPSAGSSEQAYFRPRYNLMADGGLAALSGGGASHLGDYSDGGRLLRGPGDGVSDDIPATIANKRPARLADGEFVVPARIVSELGNGSTEAGARKLYAMMDRVQKNRSKTVGKNKVAVDSRSEKLLPA